MRKSKKGSFFDVLGILIGVVLLVSSFIAIGIAQRETGDALTNAQADIGSDIKNFNESADLVIDQADKYPAFWDFLIAFVIFGFWLTAFISGYLIGNNPIFLVIYIILSLAGLVVGAVFEFALEDFLTNSVMSGYSASYPITLFIVNNFFIFTIFFTITVGIALYLKPGGEQ